MNNPYPEVDREVVRNKIANDLADINHEHNLDEAGLKWYRGMADIVLDNPNIGIKHTVWLEGVRFFSSWLLADDDMHISDNYKYPPRTVAKVKAFLKECCNG